MNAFFAFLRDLTHSVRQPCREHARTIDRSMDATLTRGEAFGLRFHLLYCRGCRRFRRQVAALRALAAQTGRSIMNGEAGDHSMMGDAMPAEVRSRLTNAIRSGLKSSEGSSDRSSGGSSRNPSDEK
jgi:hypothetical protein